MYHRITVEVGKDNSRIVDTVSIQILHEFAGGKTRIGRLTLHLAGRDNMGGHEEISEYSTELIFEILNFRKPCGRILALFRCQENNHLVFGEMTIDE